MPSNYLKLYVHLVWATYDRFPAITPDCEGLLYSTILGKAKELGCEPLAIGGIEDHLHLLLRIPATLALAEIVKGIKGASSRHMVLTFPHKFFKWQGSYGATTVSPNALRKVIEYIENQKQHHTSRALHNAWETTHIDD